MKNKTSIKINNLSKYLPKNLSIRILKLAESNIHKIKSGETISSIAENDPLYIKIIMEANPNLNPQKLQIGQEILLPPKPHRPNIHFEPSQKIIDFLKTMEGDQSGQPFLISYDDGFGNATIGWGHNLGKNIPTKSISFQEAEKLFQKDIETASSFVKRNVMTPLDQSKFDALVSLVFNSGGPAFLKTELYRLIEERKFISAIKIFPQTLIGKNQSGLLDRRIKETAIFAGIA